MCEKVIESVIRAVAETKGTEPPNLVVPLEKHVDTDAIRHLYRHDSDSWTLQFELPEHTVAVTGEGDIVVDGVRRRTLD